MNHPTAQRAHAGARGVGKILVGYAMVEVIAALYVAFTLDLSPISVVTEIPLAGLIGQPLIAWELVGHILLGYGLGLIALYGGVRAWRRWS